MFVQGHVVRGAEPNYPGGVLGDLENGGVKRTAVRPGGLKAPKGFLGSAIGLVPPRVRLDEETRSLGGTRCGARHCSKW